MNKCKNYLIPCPWALQVSDELPCFGTPENCNMWLEKYKRELPEEYQKAMDIRKKSLLERLVK